MTDYTVFSNSSFDSIQWINALVDEPIDGTGVGADGLESRLGGAMVKLHIMAQDYTDQLETAMVESMSTMPRILSEITRNEEQLHSVQAEMQQLSQQLLQLDQRNIAGVEDLSRLDTLKSNMEKCKATLEEHARWSQLVRDTKNLLEGGGRLTDSADKIETLFHSLSVLRNLPGHEQRQATCESFQQSLLSALRPILRRDVASADVAPLKEYLYVFTKLGRESELAEEYVLCKPQSVTSAWAEYVPQQHQHQFPQWLATYLQQVTLLLQSEEDNTRELFGEQRASAVMSALLVQSLAPMSQQLAARLQQQQQSFSSSSGSSGSSAAEISFGAYCVLDEFSRRVVRFLRNCSSEQQHAALTAVFSGAINFAAAGYAHCEAQFLREQLLLLLESIFFTTAATSSSSAATAAAAVNSLVAEKGIDDELFGDNAESSDVYAVFGERLLLAVDAAAAPLQATLQRAVRFCGGVQVKYVLRAAALLLLLFVSHLQAKIEDLAVACGVPRSSSSSGGGGSDLSAVAAGVNSSSGSGLYNETFVNNRLSIPATPPRSTTAAASASAVEQQQQQQTPLTLLQQQSLLAEQLSARLDCSEVDSRVLITSALRSLQAVGRFTRKFQQLQQQTRDALQQLQLSLFNNPLLNAATATAGAYNSTSAATATAVVSVIVNNAIREATAASNNSSSSSSSSSSGSATDATIATITSNSNNNSNNSSSSNNSSNNKNSIGSAFVAHSLDSDELAQSELKSFLLASSSASQHLSQSVFAAVETPLLQLRNAAGSLLFHLCVDAPQKMIAVLAIEECWAMPLHSIDTAAVTATAGTVTVGTVDDVGDAVGDGDNDVSLEELRENMLPQSIITQVGEHMLSLVQELEAFAASDALRDLLQLRGAAAAALTTHSSGWRQLLQQQQQQQQQQQRTDVAVTAAAAAVGMSSLCDRSKCAQAIAAVETTLFGSSDAALALAEAAATAAAAEEEEVTEESSDAHLHSNITSDESDTATAAAVLRFVNEWLSAIADCVVGLLAAQVSSIASLSRSGSCQLFTDCCYLGNVIRAMGITPHPLLLHLQQLLQQLQQQQQQQLRIFVQRAQHIMHDTGKSQMGVTGQLLAFDRRLIEAIAKGHGLIP